MKNISEVLEQLNKRQGKNIVPRFRTGEELMNWQFEEGRKRSEQVTEENRRAIAQRLFSRSGISALHRDCTLDNYVVTCDGQRKALEMARSYVARFPHTGGFIFSGTPGTGKNHLAAAMGNALLSDGKSVLIITLVDIMTSMKATFKKDAERNEAAMIDAYTALDLLVIDEIGVQHDSRYEQVVINQLVDRRTSAKRATGMLTNLNFIQLTELLGERVIDRMKLDGIWVSFTWQSYRANVKF